jgi:magnesium transporter
MTQVVSTAASAPLPGSAQPSAQSKAALASNATIRDIMSPPVGVYRGTATVAETIEALREATRTAFITYCYITGEDGRLQGLVVMRDMLLAKPGDTLAEIMLREPFTLDEDMPLDAAMKAALTRHYPVYPVIDKAGALAGLVRGETLFANRAVAISGQAGSMVGVEKEERLSTPLKRSLLLRHPWLQINLFTAFIAATVVGLFQETLSRLVILAVFLPVMAGQTGNTGCQALAVTLRGMTLGDLQEGSERGLLWKEGTLGFFNGLLVGVTAGLGMLAYAIMQHEKQPVVLAVVVTISMIIACTVASIAGALIPLFLKKLGADPATASSIFLTTASDVASMGIFLSLATVLLM